MSLIVTMLNGYTINYYFCWKVYVIKQQEKKTYQEDVQLINLTELHIFNYVDMNKN